MIWTRCLFMVLMLFVFYSTTLALEREINFDDGGTDYTTVIGLYENGLNYYERVDFSIGRTDHINNPKVLVHVHVGSRITPKPGEKRAMLGTRVNGGTWRWKSLTPYKDDKPHWIEFPISKDELKPGINSIELNSTIANFGNMTSRSVDILASRSVKPGMRSWYTHDFISYRRETDRNWGIRLRYDDVSPNNSSVIKLTVTPQKAKAYVSEPMQFSVELQDSKGRLVDCGQVQWSCTSGQIDDYGLFCPDVNGRSVITVRVGDRKVNAVCDASLRIPAGVEGPKSSRRLQWTLPDGHLDMNGTWKFRLDACSIGEKEEWFKGDVNSEWGDIHVPGCWQAQGWGLDYHGVAWYWKNFEVPSDWSGKQVWIRFNGAATHAKVWVNGQNIGEHLGNWSPFDLCITGAIRQGEQNTVTVRVEELPKHVSAGFPMVVGMHYGGLWQPVSLYSTGELRIDDAFVLPHLAAQSVDLEVSASGNSVKGGKLVCRIISPDGKEVASAGKELKPASGHSIRFSTPVPNPAAWSPDSPVLYRAKFELWHDGKLSDQRTVRFGMRDVEARGSQILLNGKPLYSCGVLHWGYYPHLISIDPSDEQIKKEFDDLRAAGFNMVKICLFMMPKQFYEIADEEGMLIWQEYPTWMTFPQKGSTGSHEGLVKEYEEWLSFDRNHPSIVLRDLTCESPEPEPALMERVYKLAKSMTGGLVEDNSAVLNQVITDFYDCHFYREIDTQYADLPGTLLPFLKSKEPDTKPYLTGEDYDCDTYRDTAAVRRKFIKGDRIPWWLDNASFHTQESTEKDLLAVYGSDFASEMVRRQNLRAGSVRKAMIEEFRRYPQLAGYVMTHIFDNTQTRPGFYDDLGNPKWSPEHWKRFTGDRVLLLDSKRKSCCFRMNEPAELTIEFSNYAEALNAVPLKWKLVSGSKTLAEGNASVNAGAGEVVKALEVKLSNLKFADSTKPVECTLKAELGEGKTICNNEWLVWFFPVPKSDLQSVSQEVIVTDSLDQTVCESLKQGAKVIYLARDDDATIPRRDAPFWREMSIWIPTGHPSLGNFPHRDFVDLQFYDMTQRRPFDTTAFRSEISPLVWGVNARYAGNPLVDYIFEAGVGDGKLVACCLKWKGEDNVAGSYLLQCLVDYIASEDCRPKQCSEFPLTGD